MKQATLQRFFTSNKKNENQNTNQTPQNSKIIEEKIEIPSNKKIGQVQQSEEKQSSSQKIGIQEEKHQKLSRLKRVIDSDDENEQQIDEKSDSMRIEKFCFELPQEKKQEKKQSNIQNTLQNTKNNVKENQKKPKQEKTAQKSAKSLKQSQKVEEEDDNNDNQPQQNIDFKNPTDKINVYEEFDDVTPKWAMKEFSKDKNGIPHSSPNSDPTTLQIPQSEFSKLTKCMQQFWKYKSDNYDKIIFFKLGKFYELFYEDAYIGNKYLDLNWMGRKMHTGFPEKAVHKYKALLLEFGYKVVIVDQIETPEQMNARVTENKKSGVGNTDKIVQRSISEILTKGTYLYEDNEQQSNLEERVLLVIRKKIISKSEEELGIAIFERQTNTISLAFIQNKDNNYDKLKTMLLHLRPVETVLENNNIPSYDPIAKIIAGTVIKSVISNLGNTKDNWDDKKAIFRLEQQFQDQLPVAIRYFKSNQLVMQALNGLFSYLNQILIFERVLGCARFKIYDEEFSLRQNMILDSQAIFHLEILQSAEFADKKDYSLFGIINKTTTPGGYRMLRKWVCAPLYQIDQIKERQKMVKDISRFRKERDIFRQSIKSFPDFERKCSRIYEYSVKIDSKAVFYENLSETRLKEFRQLTKMLRNAQEELVYFAQLKENFQSQQLKNMLTFQADDGLLPNVIENLNEFEEFIIWEKDTPQPVAGVIEGYDQSVQETDQIKKQLNDYLNQIKQTHFKNNNNLIYVHTKFRYEIEVPDELVQKQKPDEFEFTSQRQGYKRYITKKIKDLVIELEAAEQQQKQQLTSFGNFIFKHFSKNQQIWDTLINILNQLDVLCSLSVFGETYNGRMVWPNFTQEKVKLEIKEGKHPCLININFVPNSIDMGEKLCKFQLLTGPNMGGKSTTLRMVCVLTILAQIGCQVPCEFMELSPVDRIFTRIGAKDYLMEGKSTFFVELEETLVPLKYGTKNSLFITDELGRGTSTYDGVAIASAVIKYLINKIECRVLFATHFRILVEEAKLNQQITNVHMASYIQDNKVIFLYKLKEGACEASFGINVAKVVGIPDSIIKKAQEKSEFFENNVQKSFEATLKQFNQVLNQYEII